jgi:hypothetical protein
LKEFQDIERAVEQAETGPIESIETHPRDLAAPAAKSADSPSNGDLDTSEALPGQKPDQAK